MKTPLLILCAAAVLAGPAAAQSLSDRDRQAIEQAQRERGLLQQREAEQRVQRARERCLANHGADCDTLEGLQEWLLLDRSRADAVLDRVAPLPAGSASSGSSLPGSTVPDLSPRNVGNGR
jgi:Ni/Co efflux regulator RcnB